MADILLKMLFTWLLHLIFSPGRFVSLALIFKRRSLGLRRVIYTNGDRGGEQSSWYNLSAESQIEHSSFLGR